MSAGILIPALFFAAVSVALIVFLVRAILSPLLQSSFFKLDNLRLGSKQKLLNHADNLIQQERYLEAAQSLTRAFVLNEHISDRDVIDKVQSLHIGALSRILLVADQRGIQLNNLAEMEELISRRSVLLKAHAEALGTKHRVIQKRKEQKGETPEWAVKEFSNKVQEIKKALKNNTSEIESSLVEILKQLNQEAPPSKVTFH
jgi:gas vesicle protein